MELKVRRDEFVPFVAMAIMEACTIALTIMAKTALTGGMSPFVFVVYTNAFGSILLLPFSFFFHRNERTEQSIFSWPLIVRVFFLGFTGIFMFQNLAFVGLSFSSPIVVCAMGLQIPSFSFLLSILLGRSKLDWRNTSTRAKMMGTIISLSGAFVEELYKGPFIRPASTASPTRFLKSIPKLLVYYNLPDNWFLGCIFLAAAVFSVSLFNVVQTGTVKKYPHVMKVASFYSIVGTIQCLIFSLYMERDLSAWKIQPNFDLYLIIATGTFGSVIRTSVHVKCTQMKGPSYVPLFKPFGIFWATLFGTSFFVNSLHYGSVLGAAIGGVGYYTVSWGQLKESEEKQNPNEERKSTKTIYPREQDEYKVPLLTNQEESPV
ncbi:PREDICTED: WAT1-related protein At1g70260-like isoform X1 [Camelina sativa]|uniref:WAT1-related protein n=1 Tax=Camelina sativa TaxID=90675 RepID=A0ABM0Z8Z1_CAMSA|nr:PREDICTED: WAT1-related protein At1g70260-like isoform X2 [Camelina sativa]XP_010512105.1 PREDICTED: WAT1-related protein At1g70260-like isoform X1 [Camelina sativa]